MTIYDNVLPRITMYYNHITTVFPGPPLFIRFFGKYTRSGGRKKIFLLKNSMDKIILEFLSALKEHNDREWFQANKPAYDKAKQEFESFINQLIPGIRSFDPTIDMITARDCTFRIYRDVRFSGDKSPYKPNMGAYIARGGKNSSLAGYYVHVEPGMSFLAGGIYMPPADTLKRIREEIFYRTDEFKSIIQNRDFTRYFSAFDESDKLKKPPKGFSADFPDIELLKFKSYAVMHAVGDDLILSDGYVNYATACFRNLYPLNHFFNSIFS